MKFNQEELVYYLVEAVTKKELYHEWILPMVHFYRKVFAGEIDSVLTKEEVFNIISITTSYNKKAMADFIAKYYHLDEYYQYMADSHDPEILSSLIWEKKLIPMEGVLSSYKTAGLKAVKDPYSFYRSTTYLSIDPVLAQRLEKHVPKPRYYEWEVAETPAKEETFNNETNIFSILPRLIDFAKKDLIKYGANGDINLTYLRKVKSELEVPEFFAVARSKKNMYLNTKWLLQIAKYVVDHKWEELPVESIIAKILKRISYDTFYIWDHIKDQYAGSKRVESEPIPTQELMIHTLHNIAEFNNYVSTTNYIKWINYHHTTVLPLELNYYTKLKLPAAGGYSNSVDVDREKIHETLLLPFSNGFIYLMATLGIVELTSDPNIGEVPYMDYSREIRIFNPFYRLSKFKITPFGRFLFGATEDYQVPVIEFEETVIEFDENYLTVSLSQKDLIISNALMEYATVINERLFTVDRRSFLQKVNNKRDLREKISQFKTLLKTDEFPELWKNFFMGLQGIFNPLIPDPVDYVTLIIPHENKEIVQLLRFDDKLKNMFIKAEGRRILVPRKKYNKFVSLLRENGWVLEQ